MTQTDFPQLLKCLYQGGVILFPSAIGFGLVATEEKAIEKIYALKNRPLTKPSGIAVSPKIFEYFCGSQHKKIARLMNRPIGFIDYFNKSHPILSTISPLLKNKDTIAFFMNIHEMLDTLAEQCFADGKALMITSAHKAGCGNVYRRQDLHQDFLQQADCTIEGEADFYFKKRASFEAVTNTVFDLTNGTVKRAGLFANEISHWAYKKGLLKNETTTSEANKHLPTAILFLLSHKSEVYNQLPYFHRSDWLVLDLQDSCPPNSREHARTLLQQYMDADYEIKKPVYIRCNELAEMEELKKDFSLNFSKRITGFWLPMLRSKKDMEVYETLVLEIEKRCQLPTGYFKFVPILERSEALINAFEIAATCERNRALVIGHADLVADLGSTRNDFTLGVARQQAVLAARVNNLLAIDTPYTEIHDYEGLKIDTQTAKEIGLDAKVALHPNQIDFIQDVFHISKNEQETLKKDLTFFGQTEGGILRNKSNKLLAPPFIKKIEKDLCKKVKHTNQQVFNVALPEIIKQDFSLNHVHVGMVLDGRFPTTIDSAWVTQWKSLINNCYRVENDEPFAKSLGFASRPIPYQALVNYALCELVQVFSIHCKYHLGIANARQIGPAYYGDTLRSSMCIIDIRNTSDKTYTVVRNRINLMNQKEEIVIQLERDSLFEYFETETENTSIPEKYCVKEKSEIQKKIENKFESLTNNYSGLKLKLPSVETLVAHETVNLLDLSVGSMYCNLFRNSHPVHTNKIRFGKNNLAISGGLVMPLVCSIVANDFEQVIQEEIIKTTHLNPVKDGDQLGAMSYLLGRQQLSKGLFCFSLCTFGVRNLDVAKSLLKLPVPQELFLSNEMRPKEIERLLLNCCPALSKKLAVKIYWKLLVAE